MAAKRATSADNMRAELDKIHGRVNKLNDRVVVLETQRPHVEAALDRIEKSVERLNGHAVKAMWIILALFITALWRVATTTGVPGG
ncbi:hypothetical protein [Hyphomicrobium sp. 99]|uniref:hypothetical protein n=1 Tax=Hyphomicrobium sp. 99 TaxID=1163419 RepID=UPI001FD9197F|nr:hypothetical protein [Hyphomicrobium sp. 99]